MLFRSPGGAAVLGTTREGRHCPGPRQAAHGSVTAMTPPDRSLDTAAVTAWINEDPDSATREELKTSGSSNE